MKPTTRVWLFSAVAFAAFVGTWIWWFFCSRTALTGMGIFGDDTLGDAGLFGDSFGPINALFTGVAMIGVFGSLLAQQVALASQHAELKTQQDEIEKAQIDQLRARFEQSFFELLKLARELREKVSFTHTDRFLESAVTHRVPGPQTGDDAFLAMNNEIDFHAGEDVPLDLPTHPLGIHYENQIHMRSEHAIGPYFRVLYTILRRVREAAFLTDEEKIAYGNLLRSQLTSTELFIVALNGLSLVSGDFKALLTEFRMLKYLPAARISLLLGEGRGWRPAYEKVAFQGRTS